MLNTLFAQVVSIRPSDNLIVFDGLNLDPVPILDSSLWYPVTCLMTIVGDGAEPGLALSSHSNVTSSLL